MARGCAFESGWRATAVNRHGSLWEVVGTGGRVARATAWWWPMAPVPPSPPRWDWGRPAPRFASTLAAEVEGTPAAPPDTAHFEFGLVHHGFCWAFPRQGGMSLGWAPSSGRDPADHQAVLERMLPSLGLEPAAGERRGLACGSGTATTASTATGWWRWEMPPPSATPFWRKDFGRPC